MLSTWRDPGMRSGSTLPLDSRDIFPPEFLTYIFPDLILLDPLLSVFQHRKVRQEVVLVQEYNNNSKN